MTLLGQPYAVVEAPTWEGAAQQAKVAGVNPLKQVPALVTPDVRPRDFSMTVALERVGRFGDLFEPVLRGGQSLGPALREVRRQAG